MKFKTQANLWAVAMIAAAVVVLAGAFLRRTDLLFIGGVGYTLMVMGRMYFLRCPHCGKQLGRSVGSDCPHCGKKFEE